MNGQGAYLGPLQGGDGVRRALVVVPQSLSAEALRAPRPTDEHELRLQSALQLGILELGGW